MGILCSGSDVRIGDDRRVWVLVPAGILGPIARWVRVELAEIRLDADHPAELFSPYGGHPLEDLDVTVPELSRLLGLPRRDPRRAAELWHSPEAIRGSVLAIDVEGRELASVWESPHKPPLVYPFSAIGQVRADAPPRLLPKVGGDAAALLMGDFLLPPTALARLLGVVLVG